MSANNLSTNELLDRYISGAITAPQEAELERRAAEDPVLAEALEGLFAFPEEDHGQRVQQMMAQVAAEKEGGGAQVQGERQKGKVRPIGRYLAAASVLLLLAVAVFLLPRFTGGTSADLAMKQEAPVEVAEPAPEGQAEGAELDQQSLDYTLSEDAELEAAPERTPVASSTPPPPVATPTPAAKEEVAPPVIVPQPEPEIVETAEEDVVLEETAGAPPPPPVAPLETDRTEAERLAREAAERAATERRKRDERSRPQTPAPAAAAAGEPTIVSGRITNEKGDPIIGALVRLPGLPIGERTDTNGIFRLDIDATTSRIDISHPDYEAESFDIRNQLDDIQLSLEDKEKKDYQNWTDAWAATKIPISNEPGYALPEEGYTALRKRIEANRPEGIPAGKVKLSFTVNPDGTLEDFVFKGRPSQETMDYVGGTIARTSIWNVMKGDKPVRVYFKVVFED